MNGDILPSVPPYLPPHGRVVITRNASIFAREKNHDVMLTFMMLLLVSVGSRISNLKLLLWTLNAQPSSNPADSFSRSETAFGGHFWESLQKWTVRDSTVAVFPLVELL